MTARDWFIIAGAALAFPIWCYAVYNQWSNKPGATGRMLKGCALFAAIIVSSMAVALLLS